VVRLPSPGRLPCAQRQLPIHARQPGFGEIFVSSSLDSDADENKSFSLFLFLDMPVTSLQCAYSLGIKLTLRAYAQSSWESSETFTSSQ
jgi:hypothetical protein